MGQLFIAFFSIFIFYGSMSPAASPLDTVNLNIYIDGEKSAPVNVYKDEEKAVPVNDSSDYNLPLHNPGNSKYWTSEGAGVGTGVIAGIRPYPGAGVDTGAGVGAGVIAGIRPYPGAGVDTGEAGVDTGVGAGVVPYFGAEAGMDTGVGAGVVPYFGAEAGVDTGVGAGVVPYFGAGAGVGTGVRAGVGTGMRYYLGEGIDAGVNNPGPSNRMYCLTKDCVKAAYDIIRNMNESVDPCKDFFQFSCGSFVKETVIPEHHNTVNSFSKLEDKVDGRLLKLLEDKSNGQEPTIFNSIRNLYKSCQNKSQIEESLKDELKQLFSFLGGWPVIEGDKWIEDRFQWYILEQKSFLIGLSLNMLHIQIKTDEKNSTKWIFDFDQPSLGLARENLINGDEDKVVKGYYQYMVDTAIWLGASHEEAAKEMKDILDFEILLAKMSIPKEERKNKTAMYNPMTIQQFSQIYPTVNWVKHINKLLNNTKISVDVDEIINVAAPKYVKEFRDLIQTIPPRVQANYIFWKNAMFAMSFFESAIKLKYDKILYGKLAIIPQWQKCINALFHNILKGAIGSMFVRKYFYFPAKDLAGKLYSNIIKEFKELLDESIWLDTKTKKRAQQKVNFITPYIAYPKEILNNQILNDFYKGLVLKEEGYLHNILTVKMFSHAYYNGQFRDPADMQSWVYTGNAAKGNARYHPIGVNIQIHANILDEVFFGVERPLYMNYGAIGSVMGHEITHAFDDEGSQRDGHGNLVNWWEIETKEIYLNKTQCLIDQYANYTIEVDGEILNVNGIHTLGENIADLAGIKASFRAYKKHIAVNDPEPLLPGLNYTQRQLFWLSYSQVRCSIRRPATMKQLVLTNPHAPAKFRINGVFANIPEFSQDWGCPVGSKMNPVKKCSVWLE